MMKNKSEHMNKKDPTLYAVLIHLAEDAAPLGEIDLWPTIQGRLSASKLTSRKRKPFMNTILAKNRRMRLAGVISLILLIAAVVFLVSPQARAWAQNALLFFTRAGDERTLPTPMAVNLVEVTPGHQQPTLTPTPAWRPDFYATCGDFTAPRCSLGQIQEMVSFPLKGIVDIPEGLAFVGATGGPAGVTLVYRQDDPYAAIHLFQGMLTEAEKVGAEVGESARVEPVQIGDTVGEYVRGTYVHFGGDKIATWDPDANIQTLLWEEGDIRFSMQVVELDWLDKAGMAQLAALLTDRADTPIARQAPESLPSLAEVEESAGFSVLQPAWLPEGYHFDGARHLPEAQIICLEYRHPEDPEDMGPSLSIAQSAQAPLPDLDELFPAPAGSNRYLVQENTTVGGALDGKGLYAHSRMYAQLCDGSLQSRVLQVQMERMNFSIFARADGLFASRNWLTRQEMVRVAESITGVPTVVDDQLDPEFLTSVEDAESLVNFDLKLPTRLPEGKAFDHIRIEANRLVQEVTIFYSDGNNVISVTQTSGRLDTLEMALKDHPESYDSVTIQGQPALISQGYWDSNGWREIEDGGDGGASVIWFEDGIKYTIGGFNEYPRDVWIAIAESLE